MLLSRNSTHVIRVMETKGASAPPERYHEVLRKIVGTLLLCHDTRPWAPDIYGQNGQSPGVKRRIDLDSVVTQGEQDTVSR